MLKEPAAAAAVAAAASATSCGYEDSGSKACWLCLCGEESGPLRRPCACPSMYSHPRCLARWQLQQAGHDEEQRCRFCREVLPPWTSALAALQEAQCGAAGGCGCDADSVAGAGIASSSANSLVAAAEPAPAIGFIKVIFNGQAMRVPCMPGADGKRIFTMMVRMMFDLPDDVDLDFTFELKVPQMLPHSGGTVILKGIETFDAASTVAAMYQRQKNPSRGVCASQDAGDEAFSPGAPDQLAPPVGDGYLPNDYRAGGRQDLGGSCPCSMCNPPRPVEGTGFLRVSREGVALSAEEAEGRVGRGGAAGAAAAERVGCWPGAPQSSLLAPLRRAAAAVRRCTMRALGTRPV